MGGGTTVIENGRGMGMMGGRREEIIVNGGMGGGTTIIENGPGMMGGRREEIIVNGGMGGGTTIIENGRGIGSTYILLFRRKQCHSHLE